MSRTKIKTASFVDNAVTTAKIAANAIDLTSKVTGVLPTANGGGKTLAITEFTNSTRTVSSNLAEFDFFNDNVTQVKANSKFMVQVSLKGWQDNSGILELDLVYDGTTHKGRAGFNYNGQDYMHILTGLYFINGSSTAGTKNFKFRFDHANAATGKPFIVWNPNSSDDARITSTTSNVIFTEYDL